MKRRCSGTATSTGEQCRLPPIRGGTVCHKHGGSAPQVRAAAARRLAEAEARAVYERFSPNGHHGPVDVLAELERLLARVTAFADFAAGRIETLTEEQWAAFSPRTAAEVDMFRQALRDAGRLLSETAKLGLQERALEAERERAVRDAWVQQQIGRQVFGVLDRSLREMNLSEDQWEIAREVFPREFRALGGHDA